MTSRRTTRGLAAPFAGALLATACVWAAPALAAPTCFGHAATVTGTAGDDVVVGTAGPDVVVTWGGDDVVDGRGGRDRICTGAGDDRVDAGPGDDRAGGAAGRDRLFGAAGQDHLHGAAGSDRVAGGAGDDDLVAGLDADAVRGDAGDDVLAGGDGDDDLRGGEGHDRFGPRPTIREPKYPSANAGDDALRGGRGHDRLVLVHAAAGAVVDLGAGTATGEGADTLASVDSVTGSPHADVLMGDAGRNWLDGAWGADVVRGRGGDDWVASGLELHGGAGDDVAFAYYTRDVDGGPGVDWADYLCDGADDVDLAAGTTDRGLVVGVENARGHQFSGTHLAGDDGPNVLQAGFDSDSNLVEGRGGDDELFGGTPYTVGSYGDTGDGGDGTDLCVRIEFASNCEDVREARAASAGPPVPRFGRSMPPTICSFVE